MFSVIDATRRKSRLGTTRFRLRSVFLKIRCGSEQPISVCSAAGNLPRSLANKAESQKNSKSPMSTAYPVGRVLKMKEVVHECHNSILKSGLPVHLFLCFTPHWLGHRRKMGAISNRWIRVFRAIVAVLVHDVAMAVLAGITGYRVAKHFRSKDQG